MFLLRFICGVVLANGLITSHTVLGAIAWSAACLAVYVFNGAADVVEDQANHSTRPVASGALTTAQARRFAAVSGALAVLLATWCGDLLVWTVELQLLLGYCYSGPPLRLKRNAVGGPFVGTGLVFLSGLAGYASVRDAASPRPEVLLFVVAIALWTGLTGQSKDLPDLEGDALAGRRTMACLLGEWPTRLVLAGFALALGCAFVATAWIFEPRLVISAISMLVGAIGFTVVLLSPVSRGGPERRRRPYHVYMIIQCVLCLEQILA